jgi:DNA-binding NarL/FixJ family response regulator
MNNLIRIFIVEDQPSWQNMITRQLNLSPDFLVVGIAETVAQAVQMGKILDYEFIIIDLQLDQTAEDGFIVYNELKKDRDIQAIFLTNNENPNTMYHAFLHGGYSYIPKTYLNVLPQTIRYFFENPVPNMFMNAVQDKVKECRLIDLTGSEKRIFALLKEGLKPKDISDSLNISVYTVRSHIKNVLKKLESSNYQDALKKLYYDPEIVSIQNGVKDS